jgi:phosphotransacetylase
MNLSAPANVLIMPNLCAASISTQLLEQLAGGVFVGPILTGLTHQFQIVQNWSSATDVYNAAALAAAGS